MEEQESERAASVSASRPQRNGVPAVRAFPVILIVALSLLLVGELIFHDFVFGDKFLLYKDVGADSVMDTYPTFVHLSDYIRTCGFPSWSFCSGMGQSLFHLTGSLIWEPIVWLPRQLIAFALVFQHLLKAVIAGLLFFRVLRLRGLNLCGSLGGALGLAFSAHMCMGSCWIISADDTVCFTFVLFAAEEAIVYRRWLYLPVAVALSGLLTVFHLYLSAVLLCLYVPARLLEIYGWKPFAVSRVCVRLAMFAFLGVGLGAIVLFGSAYVVLNSPRASGTIPNFAFGPAPSPFQLGSSLYYVTVALRQFSSDMIGTGSAYRGWIDYYEGPVNYCGLLSLLIFPQAFVGASRRQRILYTFFLVLITVPIVFPWFRYLLWLFQGGYFRTFSLFSIFAILVMSMTALSRYADRGKLNLWMLGVTLALLLLILHSPIHQMRALIHHELAATATIFLILYAVLLIIGQMVKRQSIAGWIIVGVVAIELIYFDRITVNRPAITTQEWKKRIGYNDETVDAVRDIKANDNSFFRVTKTWGSVDVTQPGFNDAMVFGYYGTTSYSTYNNLDYIRFLMAIDAINRANGPGEAQSSPGLLCCPLLLTFACEKYVITDNPVPLQLAAAYEFVRRYNDVYIFRNNLSLPFGVVFTRYIPEDVFFQLAGATKGPALLHAAVLSATNVINKSGLSLLSLDELEQRMREVSVGDAFIECRATALQINAFTQTRVSGTVRLDENGILVFQMPFDAGWHSFVNGRAAPTIKVDVGLLGVVLPAGQHTVELIYRPPYLYLGAVVTLVSCAIFSFSLWQWPRIRGMSPA